MPRQRGGKEWHISGLKRHATGALDGTNTHATAGDDPVTVADIGGAATPVFRFINTTAGTVTNSVSDQITETLTPSGSKVFALLDAKLKLTRGTNEAKGYIKVFYSDATTAQTATGTTDIVNNPLVNNPVWHIRDAADAWDIAGVTENLDDTDDMITAFTPTGKTVTKVEIHTFRSAPGGGVQPTYDARVACLEM